MASLTYDLTLAGLSVGSAAALTGIGLIVTYRATGVLNFAHGAIAMVCAYLLRQCTVEWGWPLWLGALVTLLLVAPAIGLALERFVFRPCGRARRRPGADPGRLDRRLRPPRRRGRAAVGPGGAGRRADARAGRPVGPADGGPRRRGGRGRGHAPDALRPGTPRRRGRPFPRRPRRHRRGPGRRRGLGVRLLHGGPHGRPAGPLRTPRPVRHAAPGHGGGRRGGRRPDAQPPGGRGGRAGHRDRPEPADPVPPVGLGGAAAPGRGRQPLRRGPPDRGPRPAGRGHPRRAAPHGDRTGRHPHAARGSWRSCSS